MNSFDTERKVGGEECTEYCGNPRERLVCVQAGWQGILLQERTFSSNVHRGLAMCLAPSMHSRGILIKILKGKSIHLVQVYYYYYYF